MRDYPQRKNIRLRDYDYSWDGMYFVTVCVKQKQNLLWDETMYAPRRDAHCASATGGATLSEIGTIVETAIRNIAVVYGNVCVDKHIVMPNHIHMILVLSHEATPVEGGRAMRVPTVSGIVNQMKGYVTKRVGFSIWQARFHDRIIRSEDEYRKIWEYIDTNPQKWAEDDYYS